MGEKPTFGVVRTFLSSTAEDTLNVTETAVCISFEKFIGGTEEDTLNVTETAVCILFENLLMLQILDFLPLSLAPSIDSLYRIEFL